MQTVDVSFIPDGGYDYAFVFAGGPRYIWNKEDEKDGGLLAEFSLITLSRIYWKSLFKLVYIYRA